MKAGFTPEGQRSSSGPRERVAREHLKNDFDKLFRKYCSVVGKQPEWTDMLFWYAVLRFYDPKKSEWSRSYKNVDIDTTFTYPVVHYQ